MDDQRGEGFAVILLSQAEYAGPLCRPPVLEANALRDGRPTPRWLEVAAAAYNASERPGFKISAPEHTALFREFGEVPGEDSGFNRAIRYAPRAFEGRHPDMRLLEQRADRLPAQLRAFRRRVRRGDHASTRG